MRSKNLAIYTLIAFLLVISLACEISFGDKGLSDEEISLELTRQSIQQTQTAAAAPSSSNAAPVDSDSEDQDSDEADTPESKDVEGNDETDEDDEDSEDTCNQSKFVSETIPDGSVYQSGNTFTKTWVIRNNGTCDWTTGYRFVFEEGTQMGGASSMNLSRTVKPGETYTFEVDLKAPSTNGEYTGVWRIKSDDGKKLGKYWVVINVGPSAPPPAAFAVISAPITAPASPVTCNTNVTVSAVVTTNAGGVVGIKWEDNLTSGLPTKSWTFAGAESKTVQHTMTIPATGDYWAKVYIDAPNHQWFGPKNFHMVCTP